MIDQANRTSVLSDGEIIALMKSVPKEDVTKEGWVSRQRLLMGRAIEQAVLKNIDAFIAQASDQSSKP